MFFLFCYFTVTPGTLSVFLLCWRWSYPSRASLLSAFLWLHADLEENPSNTGSRLVAHREIRAGSLLSERGYSDDDIQFLPELSNRHQPARWCLHKAPQWADRWDKGRRQPGSTWTCAHWPKMFTLLRCGRWAESGGMLCLDSWDTEEL